MTTPLADTGSTQKPAAESVITLAAELGIEEAVRLHETLLMNFETPRPVQLDAGEVARIHTAALQLFCLFCRDRRAAGREVGWLRASAPLRSAAALLGMTTLLQLAQQEVP